MAFGRTGGDLRLEGGLSSAPAEGLTIPKGWSVRMSFGFGLGRRLGEAGEAGTSVAASLAQSARLHLACRLVSCDAMAAEPQYPICTGVHPTEIVLRGGYLKRPTLLCGLVVVDGRQFIHLQKASPELSWFLTGLPVFKRPLLKTNAFEAVMDARDAKYQALIREMGSLDVAGPAPLVDDLGLDAPPASVDNAAAAAGRNSKRQRRVATSLSKQLPRAVEVVVHRPGLPDWTPLVLVENGRGTAGMEAIDANFAALFEMVAADLARGGVKGRQHYPVAAEPTDRRKPRRLDDGSREYFIRDRWVKKWKEMSDSGKKVTRTLKRRPSDQAASSQAQGEAASSRAQGKAAPRRAKGKASATTKHPNTLSPQELEL